MGENNYSLNRRNFLELLTGGILTLSGLVGLGGIFRFLSYHENDSSPTEFDLGSADQYPIGSKTVIDKIPALLLHTEEGFSALSLTCTHLGCTVEEKEGGFHCPCHGSNFKADGSVGNGPADQPLKVFQIDKTPEGKLILYLS